MGEIAAMQLFEMGAREYRKLRVCCYEQVGRFCESEDDDDPEGIRKSPGGSWISN